MPGTNGVPNGNRGRIPATGNGLNPNTALNARTSNSEVPLVALTALTATGFPGFTIWSPAAPQDSVAAPIAGLTPTFGLNPVTLPDRQRKDIEIMWMYIKQLSLNPYRNVQEWIDRFRVEACPAYEIFWWQKVLLIVIHAVKLRIVILAGKGRLNFLDLVPFFDPKKLGFDTVLSSFTSLEQSDRDRLFGASFSMMNGFSAGEGFDGTDPLLVKIVNKSMRYANLGLKHFEQVEREAKIKRASSILRPLCFCCKSHCWAFEYCSSCLMAQYCSKDCLEKHASEHKDDCIRHMWKVRKF